MSRKQKPTKHMSADELKRKLYAHFHKSGSLDQLRCQLRGQLVTELLKVAAPTDTSNTFTSVPDFEKSLLPLQVSNWLVYDHLLRQDYQYALSTFVSEAKLPYPEKLLTACDILGLFGFDSKSEEYNKISKMYSTENKDEFLHSLLSAVIKSLFDNSVKDSMLSENTKKSEEENLLSENKGEVAESDFSKHVLKNLCDDKPRPSVSELLKSSHPGKYDGELAESSFLEQLKSLKQENEREIQELRHKLLAELDNLHLQEHKKKLEIEQERSQLMTDRNQLFLEIQKLKEQELLLEKEYENKFQRKLKNSEEDFASRLHLKDKELETLQKKLSGKEERLHTLEVELSSQKEKYNTLKKELEDSQHLYKTTHDKYISLLDENTNLLKKFEAISDYSILKEDLSSKSKEIKELQRKIKQMQESTETEKKKFHEALKNMQDKLTAKEPQLLQTQRELNLTRETLHKEETVWSKERKNLEQELHTSKELYRTVIQRIEEQKQDIQDLHRTIHILHYQLTNTTSSNLLKSDSHEIFKFPLANERQPKNLIPETSISNDYPQNHKKDSLKFIADAKNRIDKLQKQAEAVQDKYFIFSSLLDNNKPCVMTGSNTIFKTTPLSKRAAGNYDIPFGTSNFPSKLHHKHFNKFAENEMLALHASNIYPETRIKGLVANSLFSSDYVSNNQHVSESGIPQNLSKSFSLSNYKLRETDASQKNLEMSNSLMHSDVSLIRPQKSSTESHNEMTSAQILHTESAHEVTLNCEPFNNPIVSNLTTMNITDSFNALKYGVNSSHVISSAQSELKNKLNSFEKSTANALNLKTTNVATPLITLRQSSNSNDVVSIGCSQPDLENKLNAPEEMVTNVDGIKIPTFEESNNNQPTSETTIGGDKRTPLSEGFKVIDHNEEIVDTSVSSSIVRKTVTDENKSETELHSPESHLHSTVTSSEIGLNCTNVSDVSRATIEQNSTELKVNESALKVNPVTVDLDAAWKQKANTPPTISLFRKGSLFDSANLLNSSVEVSSNQLHSEQILEPLNSENKGKDFSKQQSTQLKENTDNSTTTTRAQESFIDENESENKHTELCNENTKENKDELEFKLPDRDASLNSSNKMLANTKVSEQEEKSSIPELENASSLSELSEVHFSCGSEREQQKDDSDNW